MYFVVEAEVEEDAKDDARDFSLITDWSTNNKQSASHLLVFWQNSYSASPLVEVSDECMLVFTDQANGHRTP